MIVATFKQINNPAPTLPIHSPHSPVHPNSNSSIQQNKLSGRYINNKIVQQKSANKLLSAKQLTEHKTPHFSVNENANANERLSSTTTHSSITCSCIKSPKYDKTFIQKDPKCVDFTNVSATNFTVKDQKSPKQKRNSHQQQQQLLNITPSIKKTSTNDFNLKIIAPIAASDVNQQQKQQQLRPSFGVQDNHNASHQFTIKTSKSEQTSPNMMGGINQKKTTASHGNNKRSTDSLHYVSPMDPWIKKNDDLQMNSFSEAGWEIATDPWIKRPIDSLVTDKFAHSKERTQENACTKDDFMMEATSKRSYLKPNMHKQKLYRNEESILSAPPSPHLITTSNISCTINHLPQQKNLPTKSASFSPARGKQFLNPFEDTFTYGNIKTLSVPSDYDDDQSKLNKNLTVNSCNKLQNRHSFSSISKQSREELQLNIRRLSEQMAQSNLVQFSLDDCNVNNMVDDTESFYQEIPASTTELHTVEKTGYKTILKFKESFQTFKHNNPKVSTVLGKTKVYIRHQKPKPMPETTC
ncbi:uncharacterized protein LOC6563778 isoform X1 [Drosophila grimshawi]|uniref:GH18031 n=1 Tax=Drosophila grimshawi TaxID=7222 RepID=B4JHR6_DROGR|nr:uncharacterized protein LOC6563778 isoform X1 [Drosophila grimshawi]EDV93905.1 GH18031 [Drosophila grimshawi]